MPGVATGGSTPLPVENRIWPAPSEESPAPLCQIPAAGLRALAGLGRPPGGDGSGRRDAEDPAAVVRSVAVPTEPGVDHAVHQQQTGSLQLRGRREGRGRVVGRGARDGDGEAGPLGAGGHVDRVHRVRGRPGGPRRVGLGREVRDVRRRVDDGGRRHADVVLEVRGVDVGDVPGHADVAAPPDGAGRLVQAVDVVVLRGHHHDAAADDGLRVDLAGQVRRPHPPERTSAHQARGQCRLVGVPPGSQHVVAVGRGVGPGRHHLAEQGQRDHGHEEADLGPAGPVRLRLRLRPRRMMRLRARGRCDDPRAAHGLVGHAASWDDRPLSAVPLTMPTPREGRSTVV